MEKFNITIGHSEYPYYYVKYHSEIVDILNSQNYPQFAIIYDQVLEKEVKPFSEKLKNIRPIIYKSLVINEKNKNMQILNEILEFLISSGATRNTCILAIGGGTLGNIAGMAAGLLFRGLALIHIPTTLIACADSVLSLKQGVNSNKSKNIIGMYYSPSAVFTNFEWLKKLPKREVCSGYVELVKNLITILPQEITNFLKTKPINGRIDYEQIKMLIILSIKAKIKLIESDPKEKKQGVLLEYGHTIGHALELMTNGNINHGEGVATGILVAGEISKSLGYFGKKEIDLQQQLFKHIGINIHNFIHIDKIEEQLIDYIKLDNKRGYVINSEIPMVIMKKLGEPLTENGYTLVNIKEELILESLKAVF